MVKIGELNSRMKDFFDIWALASTNEFDGPVLLEAITRTFERRGTPMNTVEVCFSEAFSIAADKAAQWKAFVNRGEILGAPARFTDVWTAVMKFLKPVGIALETNQDLAMTWPAGGPWQQCHLESEVP